MSCPSCIRTIADTYAREYGFMCRNACINNAKLLARIHDTESVDELRLVYNELGHRGYKTIVTKEEYDAGVALHGLPPALVQATPAPSEPPAPEPPPPPPGPDPESTS